MIRLKLLVPMLFLLAAAACAMGPKMQQLRPNMTQEQVEDRLGNPDGVRQYGDFTVYTYANRLMSGWAWDRADYHVVFDANGRVTEYGPGQIRTGTGPNVITIIPIGE